tara:strand:- start:2625 stop:3179 length:555 start_codon:yes stop_codon:yes gene_type:complete
MSLRLRLRDDTQDAHARVDAFAARLDLSTPHGMTPFLQANEMAYATCEEHVPGLPLEIVARRALLLQDLAALGERPLPAPLPGPAGALDALGVTYVIAGSHLGARVLSRRWRQSDDARVLAAGRFLSDTGLVNVWERVRTRLESLSDQGPQADSVVASARHCFSLFESAFSQACNPLVEIHDRS